MRYTIKKNKIYKEGRICNKCGATLSIYNKGKECNSHKLDADVNPALFVNLNASMPSHIRSS